MNLGKWDCGMRIPPYGGVGLCPEENRLWRGNQPGNSVNLDESVARSVTKGGRSPTGGAFLATARTHVGVHAVW